MINAVSEQFSRFVTPYREREVHRDDDDQERV